jgi:hypothetical protein
MNGTRERKLTENRLKMVQFTETHGKISEAR